MFDLLVLPGEIKTVKFLCSYGNLEIDFKCVKCIYTATFRWNSSTLIYEKNNNSLPRV